MNTFTGRWYTTFGPMELEQTGGRVAGTYWHQGVACAIEGTVREGRFDFSYREPIDRGVGWFALEGYGRFAGQWQPDGSDRWGQWHGHRGWDGIWETSFGRMRLIQEPDRVHGFYEGAGPSTITGHADGNRLTFHYHEPNADGEAEFTLADDGASFAGQWHPAGAVGWSPWMGERVRAMPNLTWLMVLEAHWQMSLADREYSFGGMLKEFFARLGHVAVRQRFFNDEASLQRWCRELMYFPEPAVVLIASHGSPEGVKVHGQTINTGLVLDCLRHASNIQLLHFSSCLVMKEEQAGDFAKRIPAQVPFPISGYTTSVDWGGSAIIEFNYLDMILAKSMTPAAAAEQLPKLIGYAGDDGAADSPYAPAGFRFFEGHGSSV